MVNIKNVAKNSVLLGAAFLMLGSSVCSGVELFAGTHFKMEAGKTSGRCIRRMKMKVKLDGTCGNAHNSRYFLQRVESSSRKVFALQFAGTDYCLDARKLKRLFKCDAKNSNQLWKFSKNGLKFRSQAEPPLKGWCLAHKGKTSQNPTELYMGKNCGETTKWHRIKFIGQ